MGGYGQSEGILERINTPPWGRVCGGLLMHAGLLFVVVVVVVVVECYCFLIYIIVGPPQPWPPPVYFVKVMFSTFSAVSLQSEQGASG